MMIEITNEIYEEIASGLCAAIGTTAYYNGKIEIQNEEFCAILTLTAIIYRRTEELPEGEVSRLVDVVPVWWEFATIRRDGEVLNDFSFAELKPYLLNL
jgi:hypothetical protein